MNSTPVAFSYRPKIVVFPDGLDILASTNNVVAAQQLFIKENVLQIELPVECENSVRFQKAS